MRQRGNNISISVNNFNVSYNDEGPDGVPVIIFIHGFPFNKSTWDKQTKALKNHYRVISYDLRGFGNSDAGAENFSVELFVNDLLSLMDALAIDKAVACGLSLGGYIVLNAVKNFPKRFDGLILCDTNCTADTPEVKEKRIKTIESIQKDGVKRFAEDMIKNLFAPESFTTKQKEIAAVKEMICKTSPQTLSATLLALTHRQETCTNLFDIRIPVLIMVGKEDKITPPDAARFMQRNIKDSHLFVIEHAGHLSNIENADEFNDQIKKFISY